MIPKNQKSEFLNKVENDYDKEFRDICDEIISYLPEDEQINPYVVLSEAKIKREETQIPDLASMNATPFDSSRD